MQTAAEREAYLKHFVHLFNLCDSDKDGVITGGEFSELYRRMRQKSSDEVHGLHQAKEWRSDCSRLLDAVDPYNQGRITFSDVV